LLEAVPGAASLAAIAADASARSLGQGEASGTQHPEPSEAFTGADLCPCRPGEAAALAQLEAFCEGGSGGDGPISAYEPGRNIPSEAGTSALSAALRFGTLSPRQAWAAASVARFSARSDEALASITVWEQELCWREFYQQALFHFPELADGPYRPQWRHFPWENDPQRLAAWQQGLTGMPIVDAAMRQLVESGWMHNRPRMIVASYLVKDLICDWRLGERFFMEHLVDGDLAANNGGWQWAASSGCDAQPYFRIFNPVSQSEKFDAEGKFIRRYLPQLAGLPNKLIHAPWLARPVDLAAANLRLPQDYPLPVVDHAQARDATLQRYAVVKA
jgi:deoxyribodipyrimidine photo-lyase